MSRSNTSLGSRSMVSLVSGSLVVLAVLTGACGSRGPLDDDGFGGPTADASGDVQVDASGDGGNLTDATPPDARPDVTDAGSEGGIVACGSCVIGTCGTPILQCLQDTGCRTTLQCVATTCLSSGTPDLPCLLGCAAGDVAGALEIFQIFQCVTGTCGGDCGSVLGGLLGGLGGGGRPPGP